MRRAVLALACACQFMVILDASIVNVALPAIRDDLGFAPAGLPWVVNAYLLTFAGFMLLGGRAADLFGHRRTLIAGLLVFSAASLVGGVAGAPGILVAARLAQGAGAALLAPATLAVINIYFTAEHVRARAFGAWSAAGGVGGMAGAIAGGALTTGLSWRWVFLINVPIGAVLTVVAARSLTRASVRRRESLDVVGAVTGTAGLATLVYGVMHHDRPVTGAGLLLLAGFVAVEARVTGPMIPLRLFRIRGVAVGNGMLLLFGGIAIAMWFFTSLLLQNVHGYSALRTGLAQTPAAVMFVVVARAAAALLPRAGARTLVPAGCACFVLGFGWLAYTDGAYLTGVLVPTLIVATGIGLVFPSLMAAATAGVGEGDAGTVGGMANTASQVGGSIGLAVLSAAGGYRTVFLVAAATGAAIAAASLLLPRRVVRHAPNALHTG
jgi:EmrB/QacA subfamily drug resistance transporter